MSASAFALPFLTEADDDRPCLLDDECDGWVTYGALKRRAAHYVEAMAGRKALVFIYSRNDVASVAALIGAIAAGHTVALLDPALSVELRESLTSRYRPEYLIQSDRRVEPGHRSSERDDQAGAIHSDLAILLSTSGSTGSPKFVRLTLSALLSNARAIASVLDIAPDDVAAAHLPLHYSFGLSTLTSHLLMGARIRLTHGGFTDRAFWGAMKEAKITHLPGVPFHFQLMQKLRYQRLSLPDLTSLAQAGGYLDVEARQAAHEYMTARGGRFYVLYGQTEASPRLTTLAHDEFALAPTSVGRALPGGRLEILNPDEKGHGEVIYYGPNVMMGYSECRDDLSKGDECCGRLETGDIGFLDAAGRLTLTGRSKRFGKVYGLRVNLDEVERLTNGLRESVVVQTGDALQILYITSGDSGADENVELALSARLSEYFRIPSKSYYFRPIVTIPRTERGKVDYRAIEAWL